MQEAGLSQEPTYSFVYDFAKHGGAVGSITVGPKKIPPYTVITSGMIHVVEAVTSAGAATMAFHLLTSEDLLTATAGAKANLTADAIIDVVPVRTAATSILTTAHTQLTAVVGTAALTAGKVAVHLFGFRSITT